MWFYTEMHTQTQPNRMDMAYLHAAGTKSVADIDSHTLSALLLLRQIQVCRCGPVTFCHGVLCCGGLAACAGLSRLQPPLRYGSRYLVILGCLCLDCAVCTAFSPAYADLTHLTTAQEVRASP